MGVDLTIWAVFLAGILSFLSPCVLPLVPSYLCFLGGASLEELTGEDGEDNVRKDISGRLYASALAFILGFSVVFVSLGAAASAIGKFLHAYLDYLSVAAGIVIIIMGLHFLGVFKFLFLNREARYHHASRPAGIAGAFVIGLAFAFGWTPCIGPVLAPILAYATSEDSVSKGATLLAVYSAGLGVPFFAAAVGIGGFLSFMKRFRRHLGTVEKIMGVLLVITGILFLTGQMQVLSYWMLEMFPGLVNLG